MAEKKRGMQTQTFKFASVSGHDDISKWIFWIGLLLAVIAGGVGYLTAIVLGFIVVFGILIGLLRVRDEMEFLIGGLAFILLISFAKDVYVIKILGGVVDGLSALISPAVLVLAAKKIYRALHL